MTFRRWLTSSALLATVAAGALGGCGLSDPYVAKHPSAPSATSTTTTMAASDAEPVPERGGTIPGRDRAAQERVATGAAQLTPQAALRRYARLYVNWNADSVAGVQRDLASLAIGQAKAQALQAAASYGHDQTLLQSGVANSGQLVALSPSLTTPSQWVLVTSEQTWGKGDYAGLPPALHVIYAAATRTAKGWVVSQWSPQN